MTISSVCPICGITKRSGKMSCCGRGGSWFGNCGSAGSTKLDHTWYEGLQACKARTEFETVSSQQLNKSQQQRNGSSNGGADANSKAFAKAVKQPAFTSAPMRRTPPIIEPARTPTDTSIAFAPSKINSKPAVAALITIATTSANMTLFMSSVTSNTTSMRMLMSQNSGYMLMTTPVDAPVTSRGSKQVLGVAVHISLLIKLAFFSMNMLM